MYFIFEFTAAPSINILISSIRNLYIRNTQTKANKSYTYLVLINMEPKLILEYLLQLGEARKSGYISLNSTV